MCLRFNILGPFRITLGNQLVEVKAPMQRALLAVLLIQRGEVVADERLIDELWRARPPASATNTLQSLVLRLRRRLNESGGQILIRRPSGYLLQVADDQVDSHYFAALAERGEELASRGSDIQASCILAEALGMWHGRVLGDIPPTPMVQAEAARLEEARLAAIENRIDADLRLGRHAVLIGELRCLVQEYPLHESLWFRLMFALHLEGRRVEALDAYQRVRKMLADEFGLEPGSDLAHLQQQILNGAPGLGTGPGLPGERWFCPADGR
jgi:DNA-binding SARP family transcriptional activator